MNMDQQEDKRSYGIIIAIVLIIIAYYLGVSAGKSSSSVQNYSQDDQVYSVDDYEAIKACYESIKQDKTEVYDIVRFMGYSDDYEELSTAISSIKDIVSGQTVSVPKVPYHPESGYYDCE